MNMGRGELLKKATYIGIFWAAFFLPVKTSLSNIGIIFLIILGIFSLVMQPPSTYSFKKPSFYFATTIALYLPIILGTFYAPSWGDAFLQLEKCVFYLLLPLALLMRTDLERNQVFRWSGSGLVWGCMLSAFYLLSVNIYRFWKSGLPATKLLGYDFTGKVFTAPLGGEMHPVYYGSYVLFMLVLLWQFPLVKRKWLALFITFSALSALIFLNSRIIYLMSVLVALALLFRRLSPQRVASGILVFVLIGFLSLPVLKNTYVYNKLVLGTQWELGVNIDEPNTDKDNKADSRMSRWLVSYELIRERPLLGYGTGAGRALLVDAYNENDMHASIRQGYDSHNQFLGYAINHGLLGLGLLVTYFVLGFLGAFRRKDLPAFLFFFLVGSICLTENYLIRNMGINFVALYGALLYFYGND